MDALVLEDFGTLRYLETPNPQIGRHDVLIAVKACGVCQFDVFDIREKTGRSVPPVIMGHEAAGIIDKVGAEVTEWKKDDCVTFDPAVPCMSCYYCRRGRINLCLNPEHIGVSTKKYRRDGAFAQYVAVPEHVIYRLPDDLSFVKGSMAAPVASAVHAVERRPVQLNETVLVIGAGLIGLLIIQILLSSDCGEIICIDRGPERLSTASQFGVDITIDENEHNVSERIGQLTGDRGVNLTFDTEVSSASIDTAVRSMRGGGTLILVDGSMEAVQFPVRNAIAKEINIHGSLGSSDEMPTAIDMIALKRIDLDGLISGTLPLRDGAKWFNELGGEGEYCGRMVFIP